MNGDFIPPAPTGSTTSDTTTVLHGQLYEHLHASLPNDFIPPPPTVVTTSDATEVLLDHMVEVQKLYECVKAYKDNVFDDWFESIHKQGIISGDTTLQWPTPISQDYDGTSIYESTCTVNCSSDHESVRYNAHCLSCQQNQIFQVTDSNNNSFQHYNMDSGFYSNTQTQNEETSAKTVFT